MNHTSYKKQKTENFYESTKDYTIKTYLYNKFIANNLSSFLWACQAECPSVEVIRLPVHVMNPTHDIDIITHLSFAWNFKNYLLQNSKFKEMRSGFKASSDKIAHYCHRQQQLSAATETIKARPYDEFDKCNAKCMWIPAKPSDKITYSIQRQCICHKKNYSGQ